MTRCNCTTNSGNKCRRKVTNKKGKNPLFCYQHQKCKKIFLSKKVSKIKREPTEIIKPIKLPTIKREATEIIIKPESPAIKREATEIIKQPELPRIKREKSKISTCKDWNVCAIKSTLDGWDVINIPKNTYIYRGVSVSKENKPKKKPLGIFYANLAIAAWYAFSSDFQKGEHGKIISFITKRDIYLLDMESLSNYKKLYQLNIPVPQSGFKDMDIVQYGFMYENKKSMVEQSLRRRSDARIDKIFVNWLCQLSLGKITGYAYLNLPGFHNELVICTTEDVISPSPYEYRFVIYYSPSVIVETFNGELTDEDIPFSTLTFLMGKNKLHKVKPKYNIYSIYCPTNSKSDAFLKKEPFVTLRNKYLLEKNIHKKC